MSAISRIILKLKKQRICDFFGKAVIYAVRKNNVLSIFQFNKL